MPASEAGQELSHVGALAAVAGGHDLELAGAVEIDAELARIRAIDQSRPGDLHHDTAAGVDGANVDLAGEIEQ